MRLSPARWLLILLLGSTLGMGFDYLHVWGRVLYYTHPHVAGTSLWVLPEFGVISVIAVITLGLVARFFPFPRITWGRLVFDTVLLVFVHFAAGHFAGEGRGDNATALWLIAAAAALSVLTRPGKLVFFASAYAAIVPPLTEIAISNAGFFRYFHGEPVIPRWLPFTWIVAVGLMIDAAALFLGQAGGSARRPKSA